LSVGQFLALAETVASVQKVTWQGYVTAFRRIVSNSFNLDLGKKKFDPHGGGNQEWVQRVDAVKLANVSPQKIQQWKRTFLAEAAPDPVSQRSAKVSINSFLRQARSLFSRKILRHLGEVTLPDPLPFAGVEFEPRQSLMYRSSFDVQTLIATARDELASSDPEVFKVFLLAVMVGLRRKEIDLLEWDSFLWDSGSVRVQATQHFEGKSEDSLGDVYVDNELLEIFRGYRARAMGPFVIESDGQPHPGERHLRYRCKAIFVRMTKWLRQHGVKGNKPLHTLRKEFGSQICASHGIHAASRQLRHADIAITNMFYTDARKRALTGLGHLLKSNDKVVPLAQDQCDSLKLGGG